MSEGIAVVSGTDTVGRRARLALSLAVGVVSAILCFDLKSYA